MKQRCRLLFQIFYRLPFPDRIILTFLVITFLYPLILPNCYNFGYNEIDLKSGNELKCNFVNNSFISGIFDNNF